MLCEKTFYELSLLSYFDTYAVNIPVSDMIRHAFYYISCFQITNKRRHPFFRILFSIPEWFTEFHMLLP